MGTGSGGNFGNTKGSGKVNGYPTDLHAGKQGKHIVGHNNYQAGKSVFHGSQRDAQALIRKYAGTGQWVGSNKERVDFGRVIGEYVDHKTGIGSPTTMGIIHYSKNGAHIVPGQPK